MTEDASDVAELLEGAARGDPASLQELFSRYRDRLRRMVRLRLSRRLAGRIDDSDVLQESFLEIAKHLEDYLRDPPIAQVDS